VLRVERFYATFHPPRELCRFTTLPHTKDSAKASAAQRFGSSLTHCNASI